MKALQTILFTSSILSFTPCFTTQRFRDSSSLRRLWWLRARYESMNKIHPFYHLNLPIFWLAACNYIGNPNIDSSLSLKDQNLSLSQLENYFHSFLCHYKQICPNCVTRHMKLLTVVMYSISTFDSTLELFGINCLLDA